ncbi:hypothetical protein T484DRAFT_3633089 [Baffinella frigidus]|nr:hypothetical protein T484DRAFT_3633089 [Cryptophyta sp. CCMP2293]
MDVPCAVEDDLDRKEEPDPAGLKVVTKPPRTKKRPHGAFGLFPGKAVLKPGSSSLVQSPASASAKRPTSLVDGHWERDADGKRVWIPAGGGEGGMGEMMPNLSHHNPSLPESAAGCGACSSEPSPNMDLEGQAHVSSAPGGGHWERDADGKRVWIEFVPRSKSPTTTPNLSHHKVSVPGSGGHVADGPEPVPSAPGGDASHVHAASEAAREDGAGEALGRERDIDGAEEEEFFGDGDEVEDGGEGGEGGGGGDGGGAGQDAAAKSTKGGEGDEGGGGGDGGGAGQDAAAKSTKGGEGDEGGGGGEGGGEGQEGDAKSTKWRRNRVNWTSEYTTCLREDSVH